MGSVHEEVINRIDNWNNGRQQIRDEGVVVMFVGFLLIFIRIPKIIPIVILLWGFYLFSMSVGHHKKQENGIAMQYLSKLSDIENTKPLSFPECKVIITGEDREKIIFEIASEYNIKLPETFKYDIWKEANIDKTDEDYVVEGITYCSQKSGIYIGEKGLERITKDKVY